MSKDFIVNNSKDSEYIKNNEKMSLISDTFHFPEPIQKNSKLFKYILYATKIEIKFNSIVRLVYNTSIFEIYLWVLCFCLCLTAPKEMYYTWILTIHIAKGILGLILLNGMPKTFEIIENISKYPNFNENKIMDLIKNDLEYSFMIKWKENKAKFLVYLILNISCCVIDLALFFACLSDYLKKQSMISFIVMLFAIATYFVSDVIYFLWIYTLTFTFPPDVTNYISRAIIGSIDSLQEYTRKMINRK